MTDTTDPEPCADHCPPDTNRRYVNCVNCGWLFDQFADFPFYDE